VTETKSGSRWLSSRAVSYSCAVVSAVFGGKNSTEKVGRRAAMISSIRIRRG
jgi:hypothetical protein